LPLQSFQLLNQRRPFDVQEIGGLALVVGRAQERAPDESVFEVRDEPLEFDALVRHRHIFGFGGLRDLANLFGKSAAKICARPASIANMRSITFSSCRTLPGQPKAMSACCESCASVTRPRGGVAFLRELIEKVLRENRHVRAPLAERRARAPGSR
jgi:hypothetical protein